MQRIMQDDAIDPNRLAVWIRDMRLQVQRIEQSRLERQPMPLEPPVDRIYRKRRRRAPVASAKGNPIAARP